MGSLPLMKQISCAGYTVRNGRDWVARNKGIGGTLPTVQAAGATYRHGVGNGSYSLVTPAPPLASWWAISAPQRCWRRPCGNGGHHVHTLHIHVHTVYVHLHTLYMGITDCLHIPLHVMPTCTALVIWMYYAIIQESPVWYIQVSARDIALKVGL